MGDAQRGGVSVLNRWKAENCINFQSPLTTHEAVNVAGGTRVRGAIHIQNVNGWHSRFKTWLRRFNGVASRYLANYTGWQRILDTAALTAPEQWLRVAVAPAKYSTGS